MMRARLLPDLHRSRHLVGNGRIDTPLVPTASDDGLAASARNRQAAGSGLGARLRKEREARGVSLQELSRLTRIPSLSLSLLEEERFDELPGDVFVRGFLRAYAKALGLPTDRIMEAYAAPDDPAPGLPLPLMSSVRLAPEGGRRLGVAVAFVLLLILFTLALSIVLKPRGRDLPVELSLGAPDAPGSCA